MMTTQPPALATTQLLETTISILSARKDLLEILSLYGVRNSVELGEKLERHQISEHPGYEDFLAAQQLENDLQQSIDKARGILTTISPA